MSQSESAENWWSLNRKGEPEPSRSWSERPGDVENYLVIFQGSIAGIEMLGEFSEVRAILLRALDKEVPILRLVRPYLHDPKTPILVDLEDLYTAIARLRPSDT